TLTWNASNPLGDGAEVRKASGITGFGKKVVAEMEKYHIVVDVSHACEKLFYDVAAAAKKPFVASHSNAASVTPHCRNLTDEQFLVIKQAGGVVGMNFHNAFLNTHPENACTQDIIRHIEHFLSLGGEDVVCFGSDFDGGTLPQDIADSRVYHKIYDELCRRNYKESLIKKIFYENALNFFENFDNC
ncbi:MAG: membrane dipeptidase, partial [Ruminococcus sp.]|nr:membrane dipeptidase [Ruminococcus sp.]